MNYSETARCRLQGGFDDLMHQLLVVMRSRDVVRRQLFHCRLIGIIIDGGEPCLCVTVLLRLLHFVQKQVTVRIAISWQAFDTLCNYGLSTAIHIAMDQTLSFNERMSWLQTRCLLQDYQLIITHGSGKYW